MIDWRFLVGDAILLLLIVLVAAAVLYGLGHVLLWMMGRR